MEKDDNNDLELEEPEAEAAYAKAEAIFRRGGSLRGMSIRTDLLSGEQRLSMGEDCEDGMAAFRRLESARRPAGGEE